MPRAVAGGGDLLALCANLQGLMRLVARAWELREAVRATLAPSDEPAMAVALAGEACRLHDTPRGQELLALALLASGRGAEAAELIGRMLSDFGTRKIASLED